MTASTPYNTTTANSGAVGPALQDGQTLDNCVIGGTTPAAATVTNLVITGTLTRTGGSVSAPIVVTGATLALVQATHAGKLVVQKAASGCTITAPASTGGGAIYRVYVETTITSVGLILNTTGTDKFVGGISIAKTSDGTSFAANSTANKTITLNGTTTGGIAGSWLEIEDADLGVFKVMGYAPASGTLATPFSN